MRSKTSLIAGLSVVAVLAIAVVMQDATPPSASKTEAGPALPAGNTFVVRGARVFDGERVHEATDVLVRDGRIAAIGTQVDAPGVEAVDGKGRTLMPGLIDAHVHSWGEARREALRFGVTLAIDLHGDRGRLATLRREREGMERTAEADLWAAGVAVTAPGGHGTQYGMPVPTLAEGDDAAAFVDARVDEGADLVKLIVEDLSAHSTTTRWPTLSPAQVEAVVAAAHRRGKRAIVHVSKQDDARMAARAGADGLAHVFVDAPSDDAFVALARERDLFVVPTLSVFAAGSGAGDGRSLVADARLRPWLSAAQVQTLEAAFPSLHAHPEYPVDALASVRRLHAAGVTILAGTDAGNPGTAHGASLHGELELLVRAGLTPVEALAAATSRSADRFGIDDRGRIAEGRRADLVLVDGDPTTDIRATRAIVAVWKNGYAVERPRAGESKEAVDVLPASVRIADFDDGAATAAFGSGWHETTDAVMGGRSTVRHALVAGGALGSAGALEVAGEIAAGSAYPWAGIAFLPARTPMGAVDARANTELVFQVRGDGREYQVMLMSGPTMQGMPAMHAFTAGPEWTEVRLPLAAFGGADLAQLRAVSFAAGAPAGAFRFAIDAVELRGSRP